ncbi:c-type cytochrome [Salinimicrobium sp. GXAS 041]|uniref:c-type cytochrome n=1 Tax=Salinimicrobium sp. GXAS 041 TaxID=3400806 RepID=UPI003C772E30
MSESFPEGADIYNNFCATCHLASGEGIPNAFPPINKSNWLKEKRAATIKAVKYGLNGNIEVNGVEYNSLMPSMELTDEEVKNVLNYIFYAWDNNVEKPATLAEVREVKE